MKPSVVSKKRKPQSSRIFGWEFLINFALVYSIFVAIILVPYSYIRGLFNINVVFWIYLIYGIAIIIYLVSWIIDKKQFFKNEIEL